MKNTITKEEKEESKKYLKSIEYMESELRRNGYFVGGLTEEGIKHYYSKLKNKL